MKKIANPKDVIRTKDGDIIADAFCRSANGSAMVFETKGIGPRVREMNSLVHDCIMKSEPMVKTWFYTIMKDRRIAGKKTVKSPYELFKTAQPLMADIASKGGKRLDDATRTLQFTQTSWQNLESTIEMILD